MTVDVEQVLGLAVQVGILIGLVAGAGLWIKKWVKSQVSEPLMAQVGPNGGVEQGTTRDLIEDMHENIATVNDKLDDLDDHATTNRTLAERALGVSTEALTMARQTSDRLDRHLTEGHGGTP